MENQKKSLFQITEAARACGLSRSTLMRMEEKGLLTPAYIAPDSGRRYYDNFNVARILQIEKFKSMGLSNEEITAYFAHGGDASQLLAALESRLRELERSVKEMRLRAAGTADISVQEIILPAVTCCMERCEGHTIAEKYAAMFDFYGRCIRRGCVLSDEPIFTMLERTDFLEGRIDNKPYPYFVCVPVRPETAPPDAVLLPECRALSVLYYGDYDNVEACWLTMGQELKARGLTPAGSPRVLGIVAPYTGREIETRRYCSHLVLPIADPDPQPTTP